MDLLLEELETTIFSNIFRKVPVMSGNTKMGIRYTKVEDNEVVIEIDAPYYDINKYKETGVIQYIMNLEDGTTSYAESVNRLGAFEGKSKKSKHWCNKAIMEACRTVAIMHPNIKIINNLK